MAWTIELERSAVDDLYKLDRPIAKRILSFLQELIAPLQDPRSTGSALRGSKLGEFWRYRVGNDRIVVSIEDDSQRIIVLRIGHRRQIYR